MSFTSGKFVQQEDGSWVQSPFTSLVSDALEDVRFGMEFAYEQGLHEFGYDPVKIIETALKAKEEASDKTTAAIAIFERFSIGESVPHEQMQAAVRHMVRLHKPVGGAG